MKFSQEVKVYLIQYAYSLLGDNSRLFNNYFFWTQLEKSRPDIG